MLRLSVREQLNTAASSQSLLFEQKVQLVCFLQDCERTNVLSVTVTRTLLSWHVGDDVTPQLIDMSAFCSTLRFSLMPQTS